MTDPHIPTLRPVAHQAQRKLDDHDSVDHIRYPCLRDGVNTSSERPPGPERTSPTPTHDGTTKDSSNP